MGRRRNNGRGNKKRGNGNGKPTPRRPDADEYSNSSTSEVSIDFDAPLAFDIGTRVELPNLEGSSEDSSPHTGTIAGHWKRRDHWPEHLSAPYLVLLDDGMAVYCHRTEAEFLRETDVPPMEVTFNIGCRVECKLEAGNPKWFPGTIVQRHDEWASSPIDTPPYFIRFDYGRERPFWGPADRIRATDVRCRKGVDKLPPLRFEIGDRVVCSVDDGWMPGQVVRKWYTEEEFENGHTVPYQVLLDTGEFIYAPLDDDDCIKKSTDPPIPLRFDVGDSVSCKVDDGWTPGMVINTHYRDEDLYDGRVVPYEIKLDMGDIVYAPCDNDLFVKKPLRFKVGDRVDCNTDDGWMPGTVTKTDEFEDDRTFPYVIQLDMGDSVSATVDADSCIKRSTHPHVCRGELNGYVHVMSKLMIYNEEYQGAEEMLRERIAVVRSNIENCSRDEHVAHWRVDLSNFLFYLAEMHQAMGSLKEMKATLDEALALIEISHDKSNRHRLLNVTAKLATHAALTNDKYAALLYSEEAIILAKETTGGHDSFRLGLTMFQCGKLNVGCNDRQRGLAQMSEGLEILTRLYGCDNKHVRLASEYLHKILSTNVADGEDKP